MSDIDNCHGPRSRRGHACMQLQQIPYCRITSPGNVGFYRYMCIRNLFRPSQNVALAGSMSRLHCHTAGACHHIDMAASTVTYQVKVVTNTCRRVCAEQHTWTC
jgi:hypothetical protein